MRALPLLAIVALCLLPAARPAPPAPSLLVLRAACAARLPAAFSEARLRAHADARGRSASLRRPFRMLTYIETCGPEWQSGVTREALATLGGGGTVVLAGWAGAALCGTLEAAARALGRPAPAACADGALRAAAVALLAERLRWRRVLLPPSQPRSECAAALLHLRYELALAGVVVQAASVSSEELTRRPQVIIVCGPEDARRARAEGPAVLLMQVDELEGAVPGPVAAPLAGDAYRTSNITLDLGNLPYERKIENLSPTPVPARPENVNLLLFYPGTYKKSFPSPPTAASVNNVADRNKPTRYGVEAAQSTTSNPVFRVQRAVNTIKTGIVYDSLLNNSARMYLVRVAKQARGENEFKGARSEAHRRRRAASPARDPGPRPHLDAIVGLDEAFRRRILFITSRDLEGKSSPASLVENAYDELLDAVQQDTENEFESRRKTFLLYERSEGSPPQWRRVAVVNTLANASSEVGAWTTSAEVTNSSLTLDRWSEDQAAAERGPGGASAVSVPVLVACLALALSAAGALGLGTRWAARRRRRRRRLDDAILVPSDFTFPADERRRVGEGMETMLSCWLQQLHEFGGPELERPDLLKQPAPPSLTAPLAPLTPAAPSAPSAPSSTCSINRVALDRRTRYKGDAVFMKYLSTTVAIELKRKATDVLLVMQGLRNENLNPFIGCLCEVRPALVFDHCGRGSLEDVLMADDIKLDWTFRLSLLTDLVKGMRYLHASPLRVHGRLSSRNCVVDSRWVLRLTDYGLPALHRAQGLPHPHRAARDLLWTAPELLREGRAAGGGVRGSQPGDVFSFAIVMQEVIVRGEPYCMLSLTPEEIVEKVMRPPPLIRPSVSMGAAPPEAVSVMRQCWSEAPDLRPDFNRLHDIFRHLHRGRKINIVDSMFEMLEKYSNNLEDLIRERTEQLDMEKKKTEQLLNRMLPRSVAERLMLGSRVEPEEFAEVSIYFSDIVGFTALAARSTPVQVVDLLNDLYTTFDAAIEQYRVYKVETIGDAYMVVGGLPVRSSEHATQVGTMALHLLHLAGRFRVRHLPGTPLHLRIGLHTGPCCAAVVGLTMPRYCLFGDTVNTASRMESTGAAWRIQVSAATAEKLNAAGGYRLRSRGLTQIKGKGAMHTYWLLGKDGFDKPLPTPPPLESEEVLFETDGENESPSSSLAATSPARVGIERQRSDPSSTPDKYAWQRSGAMSADSSPPRQPRPPVAPLAPVPGDHSAPYSRYRCLGGGTRVLRRQWSLERGEALAAAAGETHATLASDPRAPPAPDHDEPPAALLPVIRPAPHAPRYRTRPDPPLPAPLPPPAPPAPSQQAEPERPRPP